MLTPQEAAEMLQVSRQVLRKLARRGQLHPLRLNAKVVRYSQAEIMGLARGGAQ
ncbi:MAG: helix-turn-helix domain-containing protein [Verrucomicrobiia bacterium]